ncbi:hypothetical protein GCM10027162_12860 [Streptomyces incanus]
MLDDDLVAVAHQLVHAGRGDGHPELVVLDLAGDADLHVDHGPWFGGHEVLPHIPGHTGAHGRDRRRWCDKAISMKVFPLYSLTKP